jgi:transcriptional regulator with XRE-family HTH domain
MDHRHEVRDFLTTRRARISPEQVGLPVYGGGARRVDGLRREEVALLAGVSVDYYTRLERGSVGGVSANVLDSVARALKLDDAERAHLFDLVRTANDSPQPRRRTAGQHLRPAIERILDALTASPAYARNSRFDILAANRLATALLPDLFGDSGRAVNLACYLFLDARAQDFYADWDAVARDSVGALRTEAGRNPYDRALTDLVGELSTRTIVVYTVEPASPSAEALDFLASWAATNLRASPIDRAANDHR